MRPGFWFWRFPLRSSLVVPEKTLGSHSFPGFPSTFDLVIDPVGVLPSLPIRMVGLVPVSAEYEDPPRTADFGAQYRPLVVAAYGFTFTFPFQCKARFRPVG